MGGNLFALLHQPSANRLGNSSPVGGVCTQQLEKQNNQKHPFFLLMGYHPRADGHYAASSVPLVEHHLDHLLQVRRDTQTHMTRAQQLWVKHHDTPKYKVGDRVWLDGHNLKTDQLTSKLAPRRHGPFIITQVMSPDSYWLQLPHQWHIHPVFHTDLLTPYHETVMHRGELSAAPTRAYQ